MIDWADVVKTLSSTAIVITAFAFVAKTVVEHLFKRDLEAHKAKLKETTDAELLEQRNQFDQLMETHKAAVTAETARKDRIREEIARWANPILGSVAELEGRLKNILSNSGYLALSKKTELQVNKDWSITYDYFFPSTVYLFCQYFCWIRLFDEELSFELFAEHQAKDSFRDKIHSAERTLSEFPLPELKELAVKDDRQIFRLQQRAMGEMLASQEGSNPRCMRYANFLEKWKEPDFRRCFDPMAGFLEELCPQNKHRWGRLMLLKNALRVLRGECEKLLTARST